MRTNKLLTVSLVLLVCCIAEARANEPTPVFVELKSPAPTVVARYEAQQAGEAFDEALHRAAVRLAQDQFLQRLTASGILYTLTSTDVLTGGNPLAVEHRYTDLINAVRLEAGGWDVGAIRRMAEVKHISVDVPARLHLDNSVAYIRANGLNSARSMGVRGAGQLNADGTSTGQVIAVLDTGIDHTTPMFDARFTDAQFESRSGDTSPVRLSGEPYNPGFHHPKVGYRFLIGQAPIEGDDTGHGTNSATAAAGLKARADVLINNGEIVEGVAPGALLMDYKVCPSLSCVNAQSLLALEDSIAPTDLLGNPKPIATVINMSFGSDAGDPNAANGVAAGNLQFAGVVPVASAGNDGPRENIVGSPSANRRVISVAASFDPGVVPNPVDVLQMNSAVHDTPGAAPNAGALPATGDTFVSFRAPESNATLDLSEPLAQHYVDVGFADTPDQVPVSVLGRICLAERGSTASAAGQGSGVFANKAQQCAAKGGIAIIVFNDAPGQIGFVTAPAPIPLFTASQADGLFLRDTLGFESAAEGALSRFPIRINLEDPSRFVPDTTSFSSRGPNNDFKVVKPDITAPGESILMGASKIGAFGSPTGFITASGTSFSGPHIAGSAALLRDALARPDLSPSQVRAALMNTATNLRELDGSPIAESDPNNFIHETGAGLVQMIEAIGARAVMGTNEINGKPGPDDPSRPDFLPSYSFGQKAWIGTGVPASDRSQKDTIAVTLADIGGGSGRYDLRIVDAGADRGDVTRPLSEPGFNIALSAASVDVPLGGRVSFDVEVAVDGTPGGLQVAGNDVTNLPATEFLWYVIAESGSETLRMPFFLRAVPGGAPALAAFNDVASTNVDQPVVIDVLANDSGAFLTVDSVTDPANGSVSVNADQTVTYSPDPSFSGSDSFVYTARDGGGATDSASVNVLVGLQCAPTGQFFDDLEGSDPDDDPAGHEPGWTFQTALANPASPNWQVMVDPFPQSPLSSFFSDSSAPTGLKDDRLISPPQVVSPSTQLVFWHRFKFDTGTSGPIDGGVLEISTDGGASWQDIVAAGGVFLAGGYNGTMRATGNPGVIPGRDAWVGFSTFINAMDQVVVDLSAFATQTVSLRWRLTLDNTVVIGDAGAGWWVDNIQFTDTGCDTNGVPVANDDDAETRKGVAIAIDVLANDSDPDGDALSVDNVTDPPNGTATINADQTVTYTPDPTFVGVDSFAYAISDDRGASDTATVTVTVRDEDDDEDEDHVTGGGRIPGANFGFNAFASSTAPKGHLTYKGGEAGIDVKGDVAAVDVELFDATFSGQCSGESTMACDFVVYVEDNGEPGGGADRFRIEVYSPGGSVPVHVADGLLEGGNIQIHRRNRD